MSRTVRVGLGVKLRQIAAAVAVAFALAPAAAPAKAAPAAADSCTAIVAFIGHDAGWWHQQLVDALHGLRPADALPIRNPYPFLSYGCVASVYGGKGPLYWRHQLVVVSQRAKVVRVARSLVGTPYLFGGNTTAGFDCSGFVEYVYRHSVAITLPRLSFDQYRVGDPIAESALRAGDLVFFYPTPQGPDHAGIYVGGGKFIDSPHTGAVVRVNVLAYYPFYVGARRVIS